ncbi:unnamed protein product, partial [Prorocentrum cordatum]
MAGLGSSCFWPRPPPLDRRTCPPCLSAWTAPPARQAGSMRAAARAGSRGSVHRAGFVCPGWPRPGRGDAARPPPPAARRRAPAARGRLRRRGRPAAVGGRGPRGRSGGGLAAGRCGRRRRRRSGAAVPDRDPENALPSSTAANPCVERGGNSLTISTPSGEQVLIPPGASATLVDDWASSGGVGVQINNWYWSFSRPAVSAVVSSPGPKNPDNAGVTVRLGADCVAEALEAPPQCCGVRTDFVSNVTVGWNAERRCEVTVAANEWTNAVTPGCCSYGAAGSGSACSEVPTLSAGLRTATGQVSWPPRWLAVAPGWPGATPVPSWGAAPPPSQATHTPAPAPVPTAPCHTAAPGEECHVLRHVAWAKQDGIRDHPEWYPNLSLESSFEDFQNLLWLNGLHECQRPCASCHTAAPGEECYGHVAWAKQEGIRDDPEWYPNLSLESSFEDFQNLLWLNGLHECQRPCASCHTAAPGEECYGHVAWAKQDGIRDDPEWYPNLSPESSFEDFQEHLWTNGLHECPRPC